MAIPSQYSYSYRLRWGSQPSILSAGEYGVGLAPTVELRGKTLRLSRARSEPSREGYATLSFDLSWIPDLRPEDELTVTRLPLVGHESLTLRRGEELLMHLGQLAGQWQLGSASVLLSNDFDGSGCLRIDDGEHRCFLRPGQTLAFPKHRCHLKQLTGSRIGPGYSTEGWIAVHDFSTAVLDRAGSDDGWRTSTTVPSGFWRRFCL